jgi:hypothetical protein
LLPQTGLTPAQSSAFNQLIGSYQQGNPYAGAIGGYATNLLSGGGATQYAPQLQSGLDAYKASLLPYATGSKIGQISPELQRYLDVTGTDVSSLVRQQFAGAGRDLSGLETQNIARGVGQAWAPILAQQYNTDTQRAIDAATALYGAGGQTYGQLTGLQQQALANQGQGVTTADQALQAALYGPQNILQYGNLPFQTQATNLGVLGNLGTPIAQLGGTGTQQGTIQATKQAAPYEVASGWANVFGKLFPSGVTAKTFF